MTNSKSTKRALLTSVLALITCLVMLVGTTFAWFTDSVTSGNNIIKSGALDVEMMWADGTLDPNAATTAWKDAAEGAIFNYDLWEPGYTEVRHIAISNKGTLALKYQLNIIASGIVSKLADVIDVYYMDSAKQVSARIDLTDADKLGTLTDVLANFDETAAGVLKAGEKDTVTIALKMRESAGNEYQNLSIGSEFSIQLFATQYTYESDSFDEQYDKNAQYKGISTAAELAELIANGGFGTLTSDIDVGEFANTKYTIASGKKVAIDLNGHNITASSNGTENQELFLVKGELTITGDGDVSLVHTGENLLWNRMTTVADVTAGGALYVTDGAALENLGGSNMSFAVHLNNWGTATLVADHAALSAPYCAVRVFNSGSDLNTVKITNSDIVAVNFALWVHNYENTDAVNARLAIDIENGTNNIVGKIRYGFSGNDVVEYTLNENAVAVTTAADLDSALEKAAEGDTIVLATDVDYTGKPLSINKAVTLDLNGKELTTNYTYGGLWLDGGVSIKNGTINHIATVAAIKVMGAIGSIENVDINVTPIEGKVITGIQIVNGANSVETIKDVTIIGASQGIEVKDQLPPQSG